MMNLQEEERQTVGRYLDPTNDLAFKKVFGTEEHKPSLISFLNAMLSLPEGKKIYEVEFLTKEQIPLRSDGKFAVLDVRCTDQKGHQYIIEMQSRLEKHFTKRCQYYAAHSYVSQAYKGKEFSDLKPVIFLAIVNHMLFPDDDKSVISCHHTLDVKTHKHRLQDVCYYFIELPKFDKTANQLASVQDQWIYFFKNWKDSIAVPPSVQDKAVIEAYHAIERFNWSRAELDEYVKTAMSRTSYEETLKDERNEGIQEGLQKGKLGIAKTLLDLNYPLNEIIKITGLSMDQLQEI
ncbi:MAG: Rpn family recombination-promoting nuclease/putative transposase [Chlamydiales bacterium]